MNTSVQSFRLVSAAALLSALLLGGRTQAATVAPAVTPQGAPKSVFNSQPGFGKDPFFPNSKRRDNLRVPVRGAEPVVPKSGIPDWVVLKGFAVLKSRKLAIVNNHTVEAGEEFTIKGYGQPRKFKCMEIKENSVIIADPDGVTKELQLQLRPGL